MLMCLETLLLDAVNRGLCVKVESQIQGGPVWEETSSSVFDRACSDDCIVQLCHLPTQRH